MNKVFIGLVLASGLILQFGCSSPAAINADNAKANTAVVINTANQTTNGSANAVVKAAETPLPEFTDANEALTAGNKLLDDNKFEKAIEAYQQAVKLNPDFAEAYFKLGVAYSQLDGGKLSQNDSVEETAPTPKVSKSKKKGKDAAAPLTEADKAFDKAAKAYEKITKKEPKNDDAFYNLGRAYNKLNKDQEAEKALRQAVKLNPENSDYQTELGAILFKLAHYDAAVPVLKKAVELDDGNSQAISLLEKAQDGSKRTNFGIKPKTPETPQTNQSSRANKVKPSGSPSPAVSAPSLKTPENPKPSPAKSKN